MFAFVSRRTASMLPRMGVRAKHTLPELPYSYGALAVSYTHLTLPTKA